MSVQSGNLHWNRVRLDLDEGVTDVDTGLTLVNLGYNTLEPGIGGSAAAAPALGVLPASRIQVIPMAPIGTWTGITHGEPYLNTVTNTIHVAFTNAVEGGSVGVNVLFWNPHTINSPGEAMTYNEPVE